MWTFEATYAAIQIASFSIKASVVSSEQCHSTFYEDLKQKKEAELLPGAAMNGMEKTFCLQNNLYKTENECIFNSNLSPFTGFCPCTHSYNYFVEITWEVI